VLVALGVLLAGVLTGIVLGLQALNDADPVGSTRLAASASPTVAGPASSRPATPSSPPPSSASPSSAPPPPQQFAAIRGQGSGLCLDVQPEQPGAGGALVILPCTGAPTQRWHRTATGMMVNAATGLCLTVAGAAADDRARVHQEACADAPHQRWRMSFDADGTTTFVAQHTGKCLDVQDGLVTPGIPVQHFGCNSAPNQRWFLQPV
jgi:hypothetical protein